MATIVIPITASGPALTCWGAGPPPGHDTCNRRAIAYLLTEGDVLSWALICEEHIPSGGRIVYAVLAIPPAEDLVESAIQKAAFSAGTTMLLRMAHRLARIVPFAHVKDVPKYEGTLMWALLHGIVLAVKRPQFAKALAESTTDIYDLTSQEKMADLLVHASQEEVR